MSEVIEKDWREEFGIDGKSFVASKADIVVSGVDASHGHVLRTA